MPPAADDIFCTPLSNKILLGLSICIYLLPHRVRTTVQTEIQGFFNNSSRTIFNFPRTENYWGSKRLSHIRLNTHNLLIIQSLMMSKLGFSRPICGSRKLHTGVWKATWTRHIYPNILVHIHYIWSIPFSHFISSSTSIWLTCINVVWCCKSTM